MTVPWSVWDIVRSQFDLSTICFSFAEPQVHQPNAANWPKVFLCPRVPRDIYLLLCAYAAMTTEGHNLWFGSANVIF